MIKVFDPIIWDVKMIQKNTNKIQFQEEFMNTLIFSNGFLVKFQAFTQLENRRVSVHFHHVSIVGGFEIIQSNSIKQAIFNMKNTQEPYKFSATKFFQIFQIGH